MSNCRRGWNADQVPSSKPIRVDGLFQHRTKQFLMREGQKPAGGRLEDLPRVAGSPSLRAALRGLRGGRLGHDLWRIVAAHGPQLAARLAPDVPHIDRPDVECAPFVPALWTGSARHMAELSIVARRRLPGGRIG